MDGDSSEILKVFVVEPTALREITSLMDARDHRVNDCVRCDADAVTDTDNDNVGILVLDDV